MEKFEVGKRYVSPYGGIVIECVSEINMDEVVMKRVDNDRHFVLLSSQAVYYEEQKDD